MKIHHKPPFGVARVNIQIKNCTGFRYKAIKNHAFEKHVKSATSNIEIVEEISVFFIEMVNRLTSRDYDSIFDTDFASLVR